MAWIYVTISPVCDVPYTFCTLKPGIGPEEELLLKSAAIWLRMSNFNPGSESDLAFCGPQVSLGFGLASDSEAYRLALNVFSASIACGLCVTPTQASPCSVK